jgi:hypothetical protein
MSAAVIACGLLIACANNPPEYDLRNYIGPCKLGFDPEGDTLYAVLDRNPEDKTYRSGEFWAVMTFFITNKEGTGPVTLTTQSSDLRVPIPSFSPITGYAPGSCRAFDSTPVLLSRSKG